MEIHNSENGRTIVADFRDEKVIIFFGANGITRRTVISPNYFPISDLRFAYLKQVHGDLCLEVDERWSFFGQGEGLSYPEGDALTTGLDKVAIGVVTADCLPIMIYDEKSKTLLAIHAGWKGVSRRIVVNSILKIVARGANPRDFHVWIGPHINRYSFEVGLEVASQLALSSQIGDACLHPHYNPEKKYVDLCDIVRSQLTELKVPNQRIWVDERDTFTDATLTSFRRDPGNGGRLLNLIMKST